MKAKHSELIKKEWGFYQFYPLPGDKELRQYYEKKYYQEARGSYETSYTHEELKWFALKSNLIYRMVKRLQGDIPVDRVKSFLDVGCGEGWLLSEFYQNNYKVLGIDFSKAGIEKFNAHLLPYFKQSNIFDWLEKIIQKDIKFDVITLCNVIEHVTHPVELINSIKILMSMTSILIIVAPNDFSPLHDYLKKLGKKDRWWVHYPEHLSYFNKASMLNLLSYSGFKVKNVVADNPIDLNILNKNWHPSFGPKSS